MPDPAVGTSSAELISAFITYHLGGPPLGTAEFALLEPVATNFSRSTMIQRILHESFFGPTKLNTVPGHVYDTTNLVTILS